MAGDRERCLACDMHGDLAKSISSGKLAASLARHLAGVVPQPGFSESSSMSMSGDLTQAAGDAPMVFNPRILAALPMVVDGSQPEFVSEMLSLFSSTATTMFTQLDDALAHGRHDELLRLLHTLKSSSAQVGAMELSAQAGTCEATLRAGGPFEPHWPALLREGFDRFERVWRAA